MFDYTIPSCYSVQDGEIVHKNNRCEFGTSVGVAVGCFSLFDDTINSLQPNHDWLAAYRSANTLMIRSRLLQLPAYPY